jgi:Protein of unknown function (DUF1569)
VLTYSCQEQCCILQQKYCSLHYVVVVINSVYSHILREIMTVQTAQYQGSLPQDSLHQDSLHQGLLDATGNQLLQKRIKSLQADSQAQWGTMNVAQMLAHCQVPLEIMLGDVKPKSNVLNRFIGKLLKNSILTRPEFRKNSPTFKEAVIAKSCEFQTEQARLLALVDRIGNGGVSVITKDPHPFFGAMTPDEWNTLQSKHLDHHLRQFGA